MTQCNAALCTEPLQSPRDFCPPYSLCKEAIHRSSKSEGGSSFRGPTPFTKRPAITLQRNRGYLSYVLFAVTAGIAKRFTI